MWQDGNISKTPKTRTKRPSKKRIKMGIVCRESKQTVGMVNASINLDTLYVMFCYPRKRRTFIILKQRREAKLVGC